MTDDTIIVGRKRVAHAAGRSPQTISRWIKRGIIEVAKDGPFANSLLQVRAAELKRLRRCEHDDRGDR